MSASISCSERAADLLARVRRGEIPDAIDVRLLGDECAGEFFRIVIESLADSFDARDAALYEELMSVWMGPPQRAIPEIPARVDTVYVLSRVTLGADIKIVSPMLDAMRARFPQARIVFVGNRKSAELFATADRIEFLNADYPRAGSMRERTRFPEQLRRRLDAPNRIVIDPDSRMTQLGMLPACEPARYFHFQSRTAGGETHANLSDLVSAWLIDTFGVSGAAWTAPDPVEIQASRPIVAVSFGVGENNSKSFGGGFEAQCIRMLAERFQTIYMDRGAGGAEAERVTEAARASGAAEHVRFWEGSFAGFASIIAQSRFYTGYDSAGQHAAAAAGTPLVTFFRGAPSRRFRRRWAPRAPNAHVVDADLLTPQECLRALSTVISGLL